MEHERSGTARLNAPRMFSILIHLFLFVFPPRCELSSRLRIHVTEFPQQVRESRSQTQERGARSSPPGSSPRTAEKQVEKPRVGPASASLSLPFG